ncbi:UNVERIFIED_CONTAM: hypothetical protein FKN15_031500 [Acipenser sinensis]
MPKKGNRKRLKFRAEDVCSESVTVADYANSDPAIVKSGRVKKAVANAIEKEVKLLCGLEASHGPVQEVLSSIAGVGGQAQESSDELDAEDCTGELKASRKKKSKRHQEHFSQPSNGPSLCISRHYISDAHLPVRLQPDSIGKMRGLRARVIRSLYHLYEPFCSRLSKSPSIPESTPTTVLNSKPPKFKNGCGNSLQFPRQYQEVHTNPDHDCFLLRVTTLNFIFTPVVMGMTLTLLTVNVSMDMRHHRVRLLFQDSPMVKGRRPRNEQGVQIVLDPVHSVRLLDWWHPQYPFSNRT